MHLFRIIVPETELRGASVEEKPVTAVVWYPGPPRGRGAYIELWLTPKLEEPPTPNQFMNDLLGLLRLANGQYVGVTARYLEIKREDKDQLRQLRDHVAAMTPPNDARSRGWALMLSRQMVHALVEFALWPD